MIYEILCRFLLFTLLIQIIEDKILFFKFILFFEKMCLQIIKQNVIILIGQKAQKTTINSSTDCKGGNL